MRLRIKPTNYKINKIIYFLIICYPLNFNPFFCIYYHYDILLCIYSYEYNEINNY